MHLPIIIRDLLYNSSTEKTSSECASTSNHYLPHLDGLRVLALTGVLLFHFDVANASGGFIGVDCFLVLSGFLITRNILRSIDNGSFTFRDFYVRRFWRLYPASFAVAFVTIIASILIFPPDLAIAAVTSALASSTLISNIHFLHITDYFDDGAHLKPLLHTWSLSLEEQFYLCWPVLLFVITSSFSRSRQILSSVIISLSALSIGLAYLLQEGHPSFVFFMLPTRIFEFAIGTICALSESVWRETVPTITRTVQETVLSILSVLIVLASFFYMPIQPLPHQVVFVLAAVAIFIITPNSIVSKYVFGNKVLQFLGSLTYCAYLTHWPIYVFSRYLLDGFHTPRLNGLVLALATFGSAFLMQIRIENPLRKMRSKYMAHLAIAMVAFFSFGICVWVAHDHGYTVNGIAASDYDVRDACIDYGRGWISGTDGCQTGDLTAKHANVTVVGDSYAAMFIPAFNALGKKRGLKFTFVFFNGCQVRPINYEDQGRESCWKSEEKRWRIIAGELTNGTLVVPKNSTIIISHWTRGGSPDERSKKIRGVYESLLQLGHRMVLVTPPPGMYKTELWRHSCNDIRRTAFMRLASLVGVSLSQEACVGKWMKPHPNSHRAALEDRETVKNETVPGMKFIDLFAELCREVDGTTKCRTPWEFETWKDLPDPGYRRDGHHLKRSGSLYIMPIFEKYLYPSIQPNISKKSA